MDMDNLRNTLDGDQIVYLRTPVDGETDPATEVLKALAQLGDRVVFVSIDKPAMTRRKELESQGIPDDNIFFIDGSNIDEDRVRQENVAFINPENLTHLSISMNEAVDQLSGDGPVIVVLDGLTSLSMYHDEKPLRQFLHTFCAKMRGHKSPALVIGTSGSISDRIDASIAQFVDTTVEN